MAAFVMFSELKIDKLVETSAGAPENAPQVLQSCADAQEHIANKVFWAP